MEIISHQGIKRTRIYKLSVNVVFTNKVINRPLVEFEGHSTDEPVRKHVRLIRGNIHFNQGTVAGYLNKISTVSTYQSCNVNIFNSFYTIYENAFTFLIVVNSEKTVIQY